MPECTTLAVMPRTDEVYCLTEPLQGLRGWRVRRVAALLLLPYLAWVSFATFLNWEFIQANPDGGERGSEGATQRVTL